MGFNKVFILPNFTLAMLNQLIVPCSVHTIRIHRVLVLSQRNSKLGHFFIIVYKFSEYDKNNVYFFQTVEIFI